MVLNRRYSCKVLIFLAVLWGQGVNAVGAADTQQVPTGSVELFIAGVRFASLQEYRLSLEPRTLKPLATADTAVEAFVPPPVQVAQGELRIAGVEPAVDTLVYGFDAAYGAQGVFVHPNELDARIEADIRDVQGPVLILSDGKRVRLMRLEADKAEEALPAK